MKLYERKLLNAVHKARADADLLRDHVTHGVPAMLRECLHSSMVTVDLLERYAAGFDIRWAYDERDQWVRAVAVYAALDD